MSKDPKAAMNDERGRLPTRVLQRLLADPRGSLSTAKALLRARIDLAGCRSVGVRPRVYGRCHVDGGEGIDIGDRLHVVARTVRCDLGTHAGGTLEIGDGVFINYGTAISAHKLVRIGAGCAIGQYSILLDCDFHTPGLTGEGHGTPAPIVLEENVWLGVRVTVLKGVTIGRRTVVAAGSVVTKDLPPGVIAAGVPARVIRSIDG